MKHSRIVLCALAALFSMSLNAMEDPFSDGIEEKIQELFAQRMRPKQIVEEYGYTREQVSKALEDSGIARFDSPGRQAPVPPLVLSPRPESPGITIEEIVSPCSLTTPQQICLFIKRGRTDQEILQKLSEVTPQEITNMRVAMDKVEVNQQAMDHLDTLPVRNSKPRPRLLGNPNNARNILFAAVAATGVWAVYSGYRIAQNTPKDEWNNLSLAGKCKKVVCGVPGEMARHVAYLARRVTGR